MLQRILKIWLFSQRDLGVVVQVLPAAIYEYRRCCPENTTVQSLCVFKAHCYQHRKSVECCHGKATITVFPGP